MKKKVIRRVARVSGLFCLLLLAVLGIHIYIAINGLRPNQNTLAMARIDLKQPISALQGNQMSQWLYSQPGINHVLCNPAMDNIVFTYYPLRANATELTRNLKTTFGLKNAVRYVPTEKEMQSGCPAASSYSFSIAAFLRRWI